MEVTIRKIKNGYIVSDRRFERDSEKFVSDLKNIGQIIKETFEYIEKKEREVEPVRF